MAADNPSFTENLEAIGLGRLIPSFQTASLQSLRLCTKKPSEAAVSRIGGQPNLPEEIPWPSGKSGQPLSFLAQLDLALLPSISSISLPKQGALYFFYDNAEQPWGFDPADAGGFRVIFSPANLAATSLRSFDARLDNENKFAGFDLTATLEESYPRLKDEWIKKFNVNQEELDAYIYSKDTFATTHRIGGYTDPIQGDMLLEAQLASNGIYCGDAAAYQSEQAILLSTGADDWLLLLQLDSIEASGMMWGDMGRLYFLINKKDLASGNFDKVWTILQCS